MASNITTRRNSIPRTWDHIPCRAVAKLLQRMAERQITYGMLADSLGMSFETIANWRRKWPATGALEAALREVGLTLDATERN